MIYRIVSKNLIDPQPYPSVPLKYFVLIFFELGSVVGTSEIMRLCLFMLSLYMENLSSIPV